MVGFLTQREADYCEALLAEFEQAGYLPALTAKIRRAGIRTEAMPFLFELRFAKALKDRGVRVDYERPALDATTIDFAFAGDREVLAELVSIGISAATEAGAQHEIDENGIRWSELILSTANEDPRLSEEGEVLLVQQKICEKVFRNGQPVKFPTPQGDQFHIIVVDMRGFLAGVGGDNADCVQLTFGNRCVEDFQRRFWTDPSTNERVPIRGLFEDTDRPRGAPTLRQRVHGILFTRDTVYADGALIGASYLAHNPHLINSRERHDLLRAAVVG